MPPVVEEQTLNPWSSREPPQPTAASMHFTNKDSWEFPGSSVVRTPHSLQRAQVASLSGN